MKLTDLNRHGGVGASCFYVQLGELHLVIDCGLHPKKIGRGAMPDFAPLRGVTLDLIIITHCHLDHIGSLPVLLRDQPRAPVIMTQPSHMLIERMLHNSASVMERQRAEDNIPDYPLFTHAEIERHAGRFTPLAYGHAKKFRGAHDDLEIIFHQAGHVAGAAGVELRHGGRRYFFTGDVQFEAQRTCPAARFPVDHFDLLVTETTRGDTERPAGKERAQEVARLVETINQTIQRGGSMLIPTFALGRMQEILSIVHDARRFGRLVDCPIYASGLGVDLCDYYDDIARQTKQVEFSRQILKDLKVHHLPRKLVPGRLPSEGALYVVSSGMVVERTPSYMVAAALAGQARHTLGFVGYCDPDTPGGQLLAAKLGEPFLFHKIDIKTSLKARIERFELSGHADRDELVDFAVHCRPRVIFLNHGDPPARAWMAQTLGARLPKARIVDPVPLHRYQV
jgi:Cft2 family RNA processing exonuclease